MKLILGSSSKWRRQVLESLGLAFEVVSPGIDEQAIRDEDPKKLVLALARAKNDALLEKVKEPAILISGDQVGVWKGQIREKPRDDDEARLFLKGYAEAPLQAVNALVVTNNQTNKRAEGMDLITVHLRPLPDELIERLIQEKQVFSCAGGIQVADPLLQPYILRIDGTMNSLKGMPDHLLLRLLDEVG